MNYRKDFHKIKYFHEVECRPPDLYFSKLIQNFSTGLYKQCLSGTLLINSNVWVSFLKTNHLMYSLYRFVTVYIGAFGNWCYLDEIREKWKPISPNVYSFLLNFPTARLLRPLLPPCIFRTIEKRTWWTSYQRLIEVQLSSCVHWVPSSTTYVKLPSFHIFMTIFGHQKKKYFHCFK